MATFTPIFRSKDAPVTKAVPVTKARLAKAQEQAVNAVNALNGTSGAARTVAAQKAASALRAYRALGGIVNYHVKKAAPAVAKASAPAEEIEWPEDLALEVERHGRA